LSQSLGFGCPIDFCPGTVPAIFVPVPSVPEESVPIPVPSPGIRVPGHKSHGIPVPLPIPGYRRYLELEREREISRPIGIQNRQKVRRNPERSEKLSETQENHLKTQKNFRAAKTHEEPREAQEIPILGLRKSRSSEKLDNNQNATSSRKSTTMRNSDQPKAQKIGSRKNLEEEPILVELEYPEKLENSELEVDEEIIIEPDS